MPWSCRSKQALLTCLRSIVPRLHLLAKDFFYFIACLW
jgi:hypothetical protein